MLRLIFDAIFFLAGTLMHELLHWLAAVVVGKPAGFSVLPRIEEKRIIFGRVTAQVRYKGLGMFVAIAPLAWWYGLYEVLKARGVLVTSGSGAGIHPGNILPLDTMGIIYLWLMLQMAWAGRLSTTDIKGFLKAVFSISGAAIILAFAAVITYLS